MKTKLFSLIFKPRDDNLNAHEHSVWENKELAEELATTFYDIYFDKYRVFVSERIVGPISVCGSTDYMKLMDIVDEQIAESREDKEVDKAVYG